MSVTSSTYSLPGAAIVSHSCSIPLLGESRVTFSGVQEVASAKPGILCHNFITAFFLGFFGMIVDVKDIDGHIYHLNRASLTDWLIANHAPVRRDPHSIGSEDDHRESVMDLSDYTLRNFLDDALKQKSPVYIVTIRELKRDLQGQEEEHAQATRCQWNRAIDFARPAQMDALRAQIAAAQVERARHQMPCPSQGKFVFSLV